MKNCEVFLGISDAAKLAGVSASAIRQRADAGRIPCIRAWTGARLFRASDVEAERKRRYQDTKRGK